MITGKQAARYFGTEAYANGCRKNMDAGDRESIAHYYGKTAWNNMTEQEQGEALQAFNEGVKAEKAVS